MDMEGLMMARGGVLASSPVSGLLPPRRYRIRERCSHYGGRLERRRRLHRSVLSCFGAAPTSEVPDKRALQSLWWKVREKKKTAPVCAVSDATATTGDETPPVNAAVTPSQKSNPAKRSFFHWFHKVESTLWYNISVSSLPAQGI
ncbi:hypothetical protein BHM03_00047078 [Ensete ventricosum]|nr:hypothetical protein BHM03_00047078 [Ensete ventricosum]